MRWQPGCRHPSGEPDHPAGALRTGADILPVQRHHKFRDLHPTVRVSGIHRVSQAVDQLQVLRLFAVRQVPGEPHTVESFREDVLEEHPDEIRTLYSEMLLLPAVGVVFVPEGDMGVRDLRDPAVGDGSAERILRKVTDRVAPAVECLLNEGQPMFPEQVVNERLKTGRVFKLSGM